MDPDEGVWIRQKCPRLRGQHSHRHRSHLSRVLLHEDDGFGGCFAPPETAGVEDSTCMPRGRQTKAGPGGQLSATQGHPSA